MLLILPLPIVVSKNIRISIDGIPIYEFNKERLFQCEYTGLVEEYACSFFIIANDNLINEMKQGNKMTIKYSGINDSAIMVDFSLNGFTKAFEELD